MKSSKLMVGFSLMVLAGLTLTACQPVVTTVEVTSVVKETVPVVATKIVNQTQVVEQTSVVQVDRPPFTTPDPILSDIKIRQAMAYCTNKVDLVKSVYPTLTDDERAKLVMNSFIPTFHWAYAGDANLTIYPFQKDVGRSMLQAEGWKLPEGGVFGTDYMVNAAGDILALKFTTTNATFRQTWAAVWEQQMKDCGIQIVRFHVPSSWWFGDTTGLARRDFQLGAFGWVGQADPTGQTLYACDQIPLPSNNWQGQNDMGWCNQKASAAIKLANNTLDKQQRIEQYKIVQQEFTKDMVSLPLFNRPDIYAHVPTLTGFQPSSGEQYYDWNIYDWQIPGKDTVVLGFSQEPSTLFFQNISAWVAALIGTAVTGYNEHVVNYDYQPLLVKQLATLDNKKATNNDVDVKEGDKVIDANGDVKKLAAGVQVKDSTGATVEFKGGTIKMKQLAATFEYLDGLKWSDGQPLVKADLELGYKIRCDPASGAVEYITCDSTQKVDFLNDSSFTLTYLPGYQNALYYLIPFPIYPAHQPITSLDAYKGKTLADVAVKDWATLKEVTEKPLGVGPYAIQEWKKTQSITLVANKYWVMGAPKTPKIVIAFITPENIEAQLLAGQIDFIGSESLTDKSQKLADAEKAGKLKIDIIPGSTWEHIDFNLFEK
jgi:ABC-type transport system substrate-binding protein